MFNTLDTIIFFTTGVIAGLMVDKILDKLGIIELNPEHEEQNTDDKENTDDE